MSDIFISYARTETERARDLAEALEREGFSVWWDREIVGGESWAEAIERQLDAARFVLVLWSRDSVTSEWVRDEASYAREMGKLLPVLVDDLRPPLGFRELQTADLSDWDGDPSHPGFQQIAAAISHG